MPSVSRTPLNLRTNNVLTYAHIHVHSKLGNKKILLTCKYAMEKLKKSKKHKKQEGIHVVGNLETFVYPLTRFTS